MTRCVVEVNSCLHAGHWKSLKTSMVTGALFEPRALVGSMSPTPFTEMRLGEPSADWVAEGVFAETAVFFGVCDFWAEGAATKSRLPTSGTVMLRADARRSRRFTDSSESE